MKKLKLILAPMTMLPLVAIVSCSDTKSESDVKPIEKLVSNYSLKNATDLQKIFNDAIVEMPTNVSKNMFTSINDVTPANGYQAQVMRGTILADANYNNDDYLIIVKGGKVTEYTDQKDIDYSALPSSTFNLEATYDSGLNSVEKAKYSPIKWDWFGAEKSDFDGATGAFIITSNSGGTSVNVKQVKFEATATAGIVWKQISSYDTNLIGQSRTTEDGDVVPSQVRGALSLGLYDKYNFESLGKQLVSVGLSDTEKEIVRQKRQDRIKYANTHLNDLYNDNLSTAERVANKSIIRKFEISTSGDFLFFYEGQKKYTINVDISKFTINPKTGKTQRTITLNFTQMIDKENPKNNSRPGYYQNNIEGFPWLISNGGKGFVVDKHYSSAFDYICGFFGIKDSEKQFELNGVTEYDGLSAVKELDWIKEEN